MCHLNSLTPQKFILKLLPPHCAQNYHGLYSLAALISGEKKQYLWKYMGKLGKGSYRYCFRFFNLRLIFKYFNTLNTRKIQNHYKRGSQLCYSISKRKNHLSMKRLLYFQYIISGGSFGGGSNSPALANAQGWDLHGELLCLSHSPRTAFNTWH